MVCNIYAPPTFAADAVNDSEEDDADGEDEVDEDEAVDDDVNDADSLKCDCRENNCFQCLLVIRRHINVLQYRESKSNICIQKSLGRGAGKD